MIIHGLIKHPLYGLWLNIKGRTCIPTDKAYNNYGGRGVCICDEWRHDPAAFINYILTTIGSRPSRQHELDRKDNTKGYEPGNLRWVTKTINNRNKRNNRFVIYKGQRVQLTELLEKHNITDIVSYERIRRRVAKGMSIEEAIAKPSRRA